MKHKIIVKLESEALIEVDLTESPRFPFSNTDRKTARKLVRHLVNTGVIAADPDFRLAPSSSKDIPEWAEVKMTGTQYVNSHIEQ